MRAAIVLLALAIPVAAMAQNPMTQPVTPRDIPWYMAHQSVLNQTLTVCHSNAAYGATADCQNAERASIGLYARGLGQANQRMFAADPSLDINRPEYWSARPGPRQVVLLQCRRRGPGDEIAYPFCQVASQSALHDLRAR
jgi:hypothetical protein